VERHAAAHEVHVTLRYQRATGGALLVTVRDDGVGFEPELPAAGRYGLR
jgi:signal transduction histidine kinase